VLPHKAVAKIDMRLVPGMEFDDARGGAEGAPGQARLCDIEVNVSAATTRPETRADAP
jgi:hypothetical protein